MKYAKCVCSLAILVALVIPATTPAAMVSVVDDGVGRLLGKLELEAHTLVFFLSDNDGPENKNASNNAPTAPARLLDGTNSGIPHDTIYLRKTWDAELIDPRFLGLIRYNQSSQPSTAITL